jgi:DNA-binding NarL/FixJ family response regulator
MSGSELVQRLRTEMRALRILIYSGTQHRNLTLTALRARPHGFVQKEIHSRPSARRSRL